MPSDVTGSSIYNQQRSDFEFRPGPIFAQPPARRRDQPRAAEDAGRAARGDAGAAGDDRGRRRTCSSRRSSSSPPRTRSSTRARTRCPRRSSTASCCGSASATRRASTSGRCWSGGSSARRTRSSSTPVVDRQTLVEMQRALEQVHVEESLGLLHRRRRRRDASAPGVQVGVEPARLARAAQARPRPRRALGPRLRDARRREGGRRARARAPAVTLRPELWVQRRALGRHRAGAPRRGADAGGRGAPFAPSDPRRDREARASIRRSAGLGLLGALALGRPELVALAAPFAVLVARRARARPAARAEGARRARPGASARGAARSTSSSSSSPTRASSGSSCSSGCPTGWSRTSRTRASSASPRASGASSTCRSAASTGARTWSARCVWRARDALRPARLRGLRPASLSR